MKQLCVTVVALVAALLLQLTIVNGLPLPGGGAPDLVLLCVIAIGLIGGPQPGLVAGFCAGLALDLAPPADQLIGQYALVFCLIGYGSGRLRFTLRQSAFMALVVAAVAAVAGEIFAACLVLVLDTPQATLSTVAQVLPSALLYDVVLTPVVMFAAVRIAVALGVSFSSQEDSPALEAGGSARPMGLAGLARLRARHAPGGADGLGVGWLTGDSAAEVAPVGAVGWLNGPATSRRARREQARLTAALTGAAPRKGAIWVGNRPAGLRPASTPNSVPPSGLPRLRPEAGVAGSALRAGQAGGAAFVGADWHGYDTHGVNGPSLPSISFSGGKSAAGSKGGRSGGRPGGGSGGWAFPGFGRRRAKGAQRIAFKTGQLAGVPEGGRSGGGTGTPKIAFGTGGLPGAGRAGGRGTPKIAFGTGGLPGAGRAGSRGTPKIAFGSGLPTGPRTRPGRPARPKFRLGPGTATGQWLAGSRLRSSGFSYVSSPRPLRRPRFGSGTFRNRPRRSRPLKSARLRRRGITRWLPFLRRPGGRSSVWIIRKAGGQR